MDFYISTDFFFLFISIHCETAANCGGSWSLAFDQTDCGNINGCYQGGQCCSKKSQPDPTVENLDQTAKEFCKKNTKTMQYLHHQPQ